MEKRSFPGKWIFLTLLSIYLLTMGNGYYSTDGEVMFRLTLTLVEKGNLGFQCEARLPNAPPGKGGLCYSKYGLGQSLALVPFYVLGKGLHLILHDGDPILMGKWFADKANAVFTASTGLLVGLWALNLFGKVDTAVALALVYGLATMAWPYAKFNFNQPLAALCITGGFYFLWRYIQRPSLTLVLWSGLAFGWALLTRLSDLITIPWATLFFWKKLKSRELYLPHFLTWILPILLALSLSLGYNLYAFGKVTGGYEGEKWSTPLFVGLYGLLMSSGKGLFLFVPLVFLLPWALAKFLKMGRSLETALCAGLLVSYVLFHAPFWTWHGGWSWGPRFLVPTMPFLVLPLGTLWNDRSIRHVVVLASSLSAVVQFLGVGVNFAEYMLMVNDETKILFIPEYSPILGHFSILFNGKGPIDLAPVNLAAFGLSEGFSKGLLAVYLFILSLSLKKLGQSLG